jgi:hypothetical protein
VFGSLYKAYPVFWSVAHCCLARCKGVLCRLGLCKMDSQAASLKTDRRSVSSNAGLGEPWLVLRLTSFSFATITVEFTHRVLAVAPSGGAHPHSGQRQRPRAGELACITGRRRRARAGVGRGGRSRQRGRHGKESSSLSLLSATSSALAGVSHRA